MKGKLLIIFKSSHGYVKRYVDILGNALGCDAVPADKFKANMLAGYDKYLYIGSMRGDSLGGFKKIADCLELMYDKLTVCGIGMLPFDKKYAERIKETTISVTYEKFIPVFYAQGGFDMSELTRTERMMISMAVRRIKSASVLDDCDTFVLNAVQTPIDEVAKSKIQPLIDYLDDKPVDEALYSPPEITDPAEKKKFLEELEAAASAPNDKKKALKRKLKG